MISYFQDYVTIGAVLGFGLFLVVLLLGVASVLRPNKPYAEKLQTYECGEVVEGSAWLQFNVRFYVIALIFLIFDVEVVFLFPWAVVFKDMGMVALVEMGIFLSILIVGLAYVWVKSDLDWIKRTVRYGSGRYQKIAMKQEK